MNFFLCRNSSEKEFFEHRSSISRNKYDNVMKPLEKGKIRENAIDEIPIIDKSSNINKANIIASNHLSNNNIPHNVVNPNVFKQYYFNKEQIPSTSRVKNISSNANTLINVNLKNFSKSKNKNGGKNYYSLYRT